jgi:uncharacterized protein YndB with AHSA1/START domain
MIVKIFLSSVVIIFIVLIIIILRAPKIFRVTRSILINASPSAIFTYANNPRLMQEWNPFTADDPTLKMTYTGPAEGVGAQSAWIGNAKTGIGQATITESQLNKKIIVRLDFEKPFKGTNYGEYVLVEQGTSTLFTWTINESTFIPRVLSQVMNLDRMIGDTFEKGLNKLKLIAEKK